jgi:hypothetical protein
VGADSFRCRGGDRKDEEGLDQQARNWEAGQWPTARTTDVQSGRGAVESGETFYRPSKALQAGQKVGQANLSDVSENWRTPDAPTSGGPRTRTARQGKGHQVVLDEQACQFSPPDLATPDGGTSSPDTLSSLQLYQQALCGLLERHWTAELKWRLNPLFVNWLMGWPIFWSVPVPICSASPETALSPGKQSMPSPISSIP